MEELKKEEKRSHIINTERDNKHNRRKRFKTITTNIKRCF